MSHAHGGTLQAMALGGRAAPTLAAAAVTGQVVKDLGARAPAPSAASLGSARGPKVPLLQLSRVERARSQRELAGSPRLSPQSSQVLVSPRGASPQAPASRVASQRALLSTGSDLLGASQRAFSAEQLPVSLQQTWSELLELVAWRPMAAPNGAGPSSVPASDMSPPDPARTRRCCQSLIAVINGLPDDTLRRVLAALAEEVFYAIFRDYAFSFDPFAAPATGSSHADLVAGLGPAERSAPSGAASPRSGGLPRMPRLSEEHVATTVPYFAVVRSLHDAAMVAIMRRLELEAQCNEREEQPAAPVWPAAPPTGASVVDSGAGTPSRHRTPQELGPPPGLAEEVRKARQMADHYQNRTKELEVVRLEMEEEATRVRQERDREVHTRHRLEQELRRLRSEVDGSATSPPPKASSSNGLRPTSKERGQDSRTRPGKASTARPHHVQRMSSAEQPPGGAPERSRRAAAARSGTTDPQTPRGAGGQDALSARVAPHASAPDLRAGMAPRQSPPAKQQSPLRARAGTTLSARTRTAAATPRAAQPYRSTG